MFIEEWVYQKLLREQQEREYSDPYYFDIPHLDIPFFVVSSETFAKTEQELKAYDLPITKIIENNSVKDLGRAIDEQFLTQFTHTLIKDHGFTGRLSSREPNIQNLPRQTTEDRWITAKMDDDV